MSARNDALRSVLRDPTLRRLEASFAGFSIGEHATWIATLVYAFDRGGVRETGVVAFVLLSIAMITAPAVSYLGDRFRRDRVLALGYGVQSVAMAMTALAMNADMHSVVGYAVTGVSAALVTVARPALGALLPFVAETPADLTAANVAMACWKTSASVRALFSRPARWPSYPLPSCLRYLPWSWRPRQL